eukprot:g16448.t1
MSDPAAAGEAGRAYDDFDQMDAQGPGADDDIFAEQEPPAAAAPAAAEFRGPQKAGKKAKTSAYMTKYERARIIGTRAMQISLNAPILVPVEKDETDPMEIAEKELRQGKIPFIIRRKLPNGETESWKVSELIDPN